MAEGQKDVLNLFRIPPIKTSIVTGAWTEIRPTNSVEDDSPVDFEILGSGTKKTLA